jgi:hypothetical protein
MRVREYTLLERCVENGIATGYAKAFKHSDNPGEDAIKFSILHAVMLEIAEWFEFDEPTNLHED